MQLRARMTALLLAVVLAQAAVTVPTELPSLDRLQVGETLYVALASGGVEVFDVSAEPKKVARIADGHTIVRMLVKDGVLTLIEAQYAATHWSLENPRAPMPMSLQMKVVQLPPAALVSAQPAEQTPTRPAANSQRGHVLEVRDGRAIFDVGLTGGFAPNVHVRIISQRLEIKPDLATGSDIKTPSGETTAVIHIEQADANRSMALLGRGDVAEAGDIAEVTPDPLSERLMVPRRAPFNALFGFHLRPFLGLEATTLTGQQSKPVGFLVDVYGTYYFDSVPIAVALSAAPLGFAIGAAEAHYPMTFSGVVLYATDYFEIGLGAGGLLGNAGPCFQEGPLTAPVCEVNSGFTINQQLRLGAIDGINIVWKSSIFSRPRSFVFGVGRGEINVPLTSHLGLFGAGGGGENGWAHGEFGVRTYLGGVGGRGTMVLSASLGYAAIFDGPSRENIAGPSVAFGLEWRR